MRLEEIEEFIANRASRQDCDRILRSLERRILPWEDHGEDHKSISSGAGDLLGTVSPAPFGPYMRYHWMTPLTNKCGYDATMGEAMENAEREALPQETAAMPESSNRVDLLMGDE